MVLNNAIEQNESIMTVEICKPRLLDIEWYLSRYIAMPGLKGARRIMRSESHPLGARESTITCTVRTVCNYCTMSHRDRMLQYRYVGIPTLRT